MRASTACSTDISQRAGTGAYGVAILRGEGEGPPTLTVPPRAHSACGAGALTARPARGPGSVTPGRSWGRADGALHSLKDGRLRCRSGRSRRSSRTRDSASSSMTPVGSTSFTGRGSRHLRRTGAPRLMRPRSTRQGRGTVADDACHRLRRELGAADYPPPRRAIARPTAFKRASCMICARCETPFEPKARGRGGRFCSARCRARWHAARRTALVMELAQLLERAATLVADLREGARP